MVPRTLLLLATVMPIVTLHAQSAADSSGIRQAALDYIEGYYEGDGARMERALADCRTREWSLVVLHDLPNGAMLNLDGFLRKLREDGHRLVQEFPRDCTPIVKGEVLQSLDEFC